MIYITSFIISILVFLIYFITGILTYRLEKKKYNILNHFPFELELDKFFPYLSSIFALFTASNILFHVGYFLIDKIALIPSSINYSFVFLLLILDLLTFMTFFAKIKDSYKTHIGFSSFYFALSLAINAYAIFMVLKCDFFSSYFCIYYIINFLIELIALLIPKMKESFFVNKENLEARNKYNHLAFLEWLFFFLNIIFNFILIIIRIV